MTWWYRYEAKSIQSWILATDRLVELRGGSTLVEQLEKHAEAAVREAGGTFLYGAAGAGTARFPDLASLERFARFWPVFVARHAPGLELVQAWTDRGLPELRARLGAARNRPSPDLPEAGPWIARAGRSGLPAVARDEDGGLLDRGTRRRAGESADALGEWMRQELGRWLPDPPRAIAFRTEIQDYPDDEGIAVVHADGNALGQRIQHMDFDTLAAFSRKLTQASRAAARRAVAGLVAFERGDDPPEDPLVLNGRPIVAGGDDFTFLVRGRAGIALADAWLRAFEEESAASGLDGLTACAGVALVRKGFPFARAHEIAERLCRAAKRDFRATRARSRVAFERVTTAIDDERQPIRSWSLDETRALADLVERADRIGARGKLRQWATERDPAQRADQWARLAEVADREAWAAFVAALERFPAEDRPVAVRQALTWSRIHPRDGRDRLWRDT